MRSNQVLTPDVDRNDQKRNVTDHVQQITLQHQNLDHNNFVDT
jgi:hypothetical protein